MDWLNQKQAFSKGDRKLLHFHSQEPSVFSIETIRLWKSQPQGTLKCETETHISEESFQHWVNQICSPLDGSHKPGIVLVMHPRLTGQHATAGVSLGAMSLHCGEETFQKVVKQMFQHRSLLNVIKRNASTAVFSSRTLTWKDGPMGGKSIIYNCRSDTESPTDEDDVALSVTYFPEVPITFAVMYGCIKKSRKQVVGRYIEQLRDLGQIGHPMLLPMLFAELERKRLLNLLDRKKTDLQQRILDMESKLDAQASKRRDVDVDKEATRRDFETTKLWMDVSSLKNGLESFKIQLNRMIKHSGTLSGTFSPSQLQREDSQLDERAAGDMIEERLDEMVVEIESKMRSTENILGGLSLATQMEWNHYTRKDTRANIDIANATKKDSTRMKNISLVGMIFLPGTFLATLFSMGFFDWNASERSSMVSPYIALYLVPAALFTLFALWHWRKWHKEETETENKFVSSQAEKEISDAGTIV